MSDTHAVGDMIAARKSGGLGRIAMSLLTLAFPWHTGTAVTVVKDGQPVSAIVLARQPTRSAQLAAAELREHIRIMSGAGIPIIRENVPIEAGMIPIYVGESEAMRAMGLTPAQFAPHESLVKVTATNVAVIGRDDLDFGPISYEQNGTWPGFQARQPFYRLGTLYAAYNLLEQWCGVRWYMVTDIGRVVPERKTVAFKTGEFRDQPWTSYRLTSKSAWQKPGEFPEQGKTNTLVAGRDENLHVLRSRMGGEPYNVNHSIYSYHERFGKEHPDWFVGNSPGRQVQLKFNHPEVIEQVARDAVDYFRKPFSERRWNRPGSNAPGVGAGDFFACVPKDNRDYGAECDPPLQPDRQRPGMFGNGTASDYIFTWVNRVAEKVNKECPDGWISAIAYAGMFEPPKSEMQPNVAVTVCMADSWTGYGLEILKAWRPKVGRLFLWEYYIDGANFPRHHPREIAAYLRELRAMAAEGMFIEMDSKAGGAENSNPALYHLNHYITFRMLRERNVDADALLEEYYKLFYGKAAAPMKAFWSDLENACKKMGAQNMSSAVGGAVSKMYQDWGFCASPEKLAVLDKYLTEADRLAADHVEKDRVALVRSGVFGYLKFRGDLARTILNFERPTLVAKRAKTPVQVDGNLDKPVWKAAVPGGAFATLQNHPVEVRTVCQAAYDDNNLYLAVRCAEPDMASIRMDQKLSSAGACTDDSVELFIDIGNRKTDYIQVIVSAGGLTWYQWKGKYPPNKTPDLGIQGRAQRGEKEWSVELVLPLARCGVSAPVTGQTWGLNVMRNRYFKGMQWADERAWLAWSPTFVASYHVIERFGLLKFE